MPNRIFVDTLFVIALVNSRDQYHARAAALADQYDGHPLLITDAVLLEIGNALARNHKREAIEIIEQFLGSESNGIDVVRLTPELFAQAVDLYRSFQDKAWGLVDCVSFVVMRHAGITDALTFDRYFAQAGFNILMGDNTPA
ncbi:MAG: PIN domain-containing protein [Isosphaeraceae bacterium]